MRRLRFVSLLHRTRKQSKQRSVINRLRGLALTRQRRIALERGPFVRVNRTNGLRRLRGAFDLWTHAMAKREIARSERVASGVVQLNRLGVRSAIRKWFVFARTRSIARQRAEALTAASVVITKTRVINQWRSAVTRNREIAGSAAAVQTCHNRRTALRVLAAWKNQSKFDFRVLCDQPTLA